MRASVTEDNVWRNLSNHTSRTNKTKQLSYGRGGGGGGGSLDPIAPHSRLVRVPDPKRGLEMKFRSTSPATFVFLL